MTAVSVAFFLFASLLGLTPALTIVGGPLVDGLALGIVAAAVGIVAITINQDDLGRLSRLVGPIALVVLAPGIWMLLQISPLPGRWLAHPVWTSAAAALGSPLGGLISIDVGSTLLSLARYCQLVGITLLAATFALDRRRAEALFILSMMVAAIIAAGTILSNPGVHYGFGRPAGRAETLNVAVIGLVLAGATAIRVFERYQSSRSPSGMTTWLLIALSGTTFMVSLAAIVANPAQIAIFAALFGLATLSAVVIARRLRVRLWGQAGIAAIAIISVCAFVVTRSGPRDVDATLILAGGSQASIAVADRMLLDIAWTGSGAGTFEALLPIYVDVHAAASDGTTAPTAAALIAVELGLPAVWLLTFAALVAAVLLFGGALQRGRDYFYPGAGVACILVVVILSFGDAGIFGRAAAPLVGVICGVALAQSRGRSEPTQSQSQSAEKRVLARPQVWSRVALMSFCAVCALQAAWIVVVELQRPRTMHMPLDAQAASLARLEQNRLQRAAALAVVRGDLWAQSAFTYSSLIFSDAMRPSETSGNLDAIRARTNLDRAVNYSPHRGDVWLMLAALAEQYKWSPSGPANLLKMSFYTAPNELALVPLRVLVASRITGIDDPEIQDMIKRDIRLVVTRTTDPNSVLLAAHKNASAKNRPLIERFISEVDPNSAALFRRPARNLN
jgi:hypothetical protein